MAESHRNDPGDHSRVEKASNKQKQPPPQQSHRRKRQLANTKEWWSKEGLMYEIQCCPIPMCFFDGTACESDELFEKCLKEISRQGGVFSNKVPEYGYGLVLVRHKGYHDLFAKMRQWGAFLYPYRLNPKSYTVPEGHNKNLHVQFPATKEHGGESESFESLFQQDVIAPLIEFDVLTPYDCQWVPLPQKPAPHLRKMSQVASSTPSEAPAKSKGSGMIVFDVIDSHTYGMARMWILSCFPRLKIDWQQEEETSLCSTRCAKDTFHTDFPGGLPCEEATKGANEQKNWCGPNHFALLLDE